MSKTRKSVKTQSRLTAAWGLTTNDQEGDGNVLKLDYGDDGTTTYVYQKSLNCTFKIGEFVVCKSYRALLKLYTWTASQIHIHQKNLRNFKG